MQKRLLITYIVLISVMLSAFIWIVNSSLSESVQSQYEVHFINELNLLKTIIEKDQPDSTRMQEYFDKMGPITDARITYIDRQGIVLADTYENPELMDNHINREEVEELLSQNEYGLAIRYSSTMKENFMYTATLISIDGVDYIVRISKPMAELEALNKNIQRFAVNLSIFAAVAASMMGYFLSKWMITPIHDLITSVGLITRGDYGRKIYPYRNDEIGKLADSFDSMRENLSSTMTDLTTRNAELKSILNSMVNGIIAVDRNRNIIMINQQSFEILNLPEQFVGKQDSMYKIIKNEEIIQMIDEAMHLGVAKSKELVHNHLEKTLRVYIHPILTETREILGSMIILEDVSQIRKLEHIRSEFVSNVSHELKTPLTSIMGFVDTLKAGAMKDGEKSKRFLGIIETEAERLHRLISDILLLSEIESAENELDATRVDISDVIKEVVDMISINIDSKPVELSIEHLEKAFVLANRDRIKQMLINLVDNAVKYTEVGYVHIRLTTSGKHAVIEIEDTGIGISDVDKARLFERFYRVDKARSRKAGGTGLGLSIVKHIINLYKGEIHVQSKSGEGSTFLVRLPLA
ncbi:MULTISPECIES: ATP-binding protein [unclassified Fusibacter]|uniref:HAMP domain-containing sensor histidine kinase n=1 Tax=unclassified Fusibacter TaxID=2624464 RepID=UPI00101177DB|nr:MULTISPECIES: ATP-binding protein [unclassified Fusibacter]MCK8061297.1 ATP-binding protein [Fusibacter sp. A2]NPE23506.1 HAMP domain-containing protein [Fusibacter sp. A1]RXV59111.1 HAMP domain-containing protein [Fusibacter sp. A1]